MGTCIYGTIIARVRHGVAVVQTPCNYLLSLTVRVDVSFDLNIDFARLLRARQMEMNTKENERLIKNLQLEARKEAAVSRRRSCSLSVTLRTRRLRHANYCCPDRTIRA